jgi:pimeloyl-ACP methyl ester carboxylesterase
VLLHGAFMTISSNWTGWIGELSRARKVIAVEMQGHGRTDDIERDFSHENLADDVPALLDHLKVPRADLIGDSVGLKATKARMFFIRGDADGVRSISSSSAMAGS